MPNTTSPAAQALINAPTDLSVKEHRLYVELSQAYVEEMLPTMAGRVFGSVVGLLSAFMASKASYALSLMPGIGGGASIVKAGGREVVAAAITTGAKTNLFSKAISKMASKLSTVAPSLFEKGKVNAGKIAFWASLGMVEDIASDGDYLLTILRRKIDAPKEFYEEAPTIAKTLREFTEALGAPVDSDGNGPFRDYIEKNRDSLKEFTLTFEELCYDVFYLEMVQRYVRQEVSVPKGRENEWIFAIQTWLAVLMRHFLVNEIDTLTISPAYPFYGWLTGIPQAVVDALNTITVNSLTMRDIMLAMGFTDSETFQSVGTSVLSMGSVAMIESIQHVTHAKGVLSIIGRKAMLGSVKKLSPVVLRANDMLD